jgi:alginate O-acetyltransferase complex protein AlgI
VTIASLGFLGFAIAVGLVYRFARPVWWRQSVLLIANLIFLASFASSYTSMIPLLGFLVIGYLSLHMCQRGVSRSGFVTILILVVALFFWLKRYSFLPQASFLPFVYNVIGLSYIFFRVMHVIIDAYSGDLQDRVTPVAYLNYVLNFTSLVSGPIQRYQDYASTQLCAERPPFDWPLLGRACERIVTGLFKVVVLAAILHAVHLRGLSAFASETTLAGHIMAVLVITVGYTFYLYCNFSGYTDIVIGTALFYRLSLPENFNHPFFSCSFLEFWSRWHITLSGWLKTYVYNPLVLFLMQRFPSPRVAVFLGVTAFFVTFFLIGLWHGQTSEFAVYGVVLGLGVSCNKLYQVEMARRLGRKRYRALTEHSLYRAGARGLTFTWFVFSLVFFWGNWQVIGQLAHGLGSVGIAAAFLGLALVASVLLTAGIALRNGCMRIQAFGAPVLLSRYSRTVSCTAMGAIAVAGLILLATPAPDIVYKAF